MPWPDSSLVKRRLELVRCAQLKRESITALALRLGFSRKTAHKWIARHAEFGAAGLADRKRAPKARPQQLPTAWQERVVALRLAHPTWGAKKLHALLIDVLAPAAAPSERTIVRWLAQRGLCQRRVRRARPGLRLSRPALRWPLRPNDVWTVDFKGAFRTGDGQRCEPLTVRDLFSRMILAIELLPNSRQSTLRRAFTCLFRSYGLPATIRVDNGQPFASAAPYGCSTLSLWWMRLGIRVDFTRRAHPQDNASHEQFHRVYKAETLRPPAPCPRAQQRRSQRWLTHYNSERPHEALGQQPPATFYRKSPRRYRPLPAHFAYPAHWRIYRVDPKGYIRWLGHSRLLSRILARTRVGLHPTSASTAEVYLEKILLGYLHRDDPHGMRPVVYEPPNCHPCRGAKV